MFRRQREHWWLSIWIGSRTCVWMPPCRTFDAGNSIVVENSATDAFALARVTDWEGNESADSMRYSAPVRVTSETTEHGLVIECIGGIVHVSGAELEATVTVVDITGRLVAVANSVSFPWRSAPLPAGVYLVATRLVDGSGSVRTMISLP